MRANRNPIPTGLIALGMLIAIPASVAAQGLQSDAPVASEQLGGTVLSLTPTVGFDRAVLRVTGPDGYSLTKNFDAAAPITVDLLADAEPKLASQSETDGDAAVRSQVRTALPDGAYRFEAVFSTPTGESRAHTGHFVVDNGNPTGLQATSGLLEPGSDGAGRVASDAGSTAETPVPQNFNVDNLLQVLDTADDRMTHIFLESDSTSTPPSNWHIRNDFGDLRFREFSGGGVSNDRMALVAGGNVGIGTTAPQDRLHVVANRALRLDSGSGFFFVQQIGPIGLWFRRSDDQPSFKLNNTAVINSLVVDGAGVGIGTSSPLADIDVGDLTGNGLTNIRFAVGSHSWTNAVPGTSGNFIFNRQGTGGPEFTVTQRLDPNATLVVDGHVRGTSFKSSSSRTLKTAFESIEPLDVLASLASLPVTAWRYKTEGDQVRHVGPVAEDFQRLFGLGDGRTIASVDADGVLMAAVKGLKNLLDAKDAEIAEVRDRNSELEERLAAVEARLGVSTP